VENGERKYHRYSVRRLNPFRGVIQILASSNARAISSDGRYWEIQIRTRRPDDMWGTAPSDQSVAQFLRFGIWNIRSGLRQVPANPLLDLSHMLKASQRLIKELEQVQSTIPFPLVDRHELWLLDARSQMPLALIDSSSRRDALQMPDDLRWRAAQQQATVAGPPTRTRDRFPHLRMAQLEEVIAKAAGDARVQWFARNPDGSASGLPSATDVPLSGRILTAEQFPTLLLQERWADPATRALADDYLAWNAARLLTLQSLSNATRSRLEQQARHDASGVERLWRLYPEIIDSACIDAARVEARIRAAR